jgi:hypothetical protein
MAHEEFIKLSGEIAGTIGERPLDKALQAHLSATYPPDGDVFRRIEALCAQGEKDGWLCTREAGDIRFSRPVKPGGEAGRFSVDVVRMKNVKGPHHVHTKGEIGMIMPIDGAPRFDGMDRGWYVYEIGSDHWPTVSGGTAYVVYFLPDGAIEFTGK